MPELSSQTFEFPEAIEAIEDCFRRGWTDGLPVIPPTPERVSEFLRAAGRDANDTIATVATRRRRITAEKAAINSVMAGCQPEYFRVVLAILDAMAAPEFNFHGSITSTGGSAQLVIVNGYIRHEIGLNSGVNVLGPGNRANATIGRAIRLLLINVCGAVPGVLDQSTHGHGGKYSMVIAEDEESSPWPPLAVDLGADENSSAVTVFAAEGPHNIQDHFSRTGKDVLNAIAMEMASAGSWSDGQSAVVIAPEHRRLLARDNWTRQAIQEYLYEHATRSTAELERAGKLPPDVCPEDEHEVRRRGISPDDILVVAAGGPAGGHSAFVPAWSRGRNSLYVTRTIS